MDKYRCTLGDLIKVACEDLPNDEKLTLEDIIDLPIHFQSLYEADMCMLSVYMDDDKKVIHIDVGND